MFRDALGIAELGRLLRDPVYHGTGVARGDGRNVVVIPGLFGGDLYLEPMRAWLRRIGYTPIRSTITINAGCPLRLRDQVQAQIARQRPLKTARFGLIGHSRGGVLAWSIAVQMGAQVSHLAVLGAPLRTYRYLGASGGAVNPSTQMGRWLRQASDFTRRIIDPGCDFPRCDCSFIRDMVRPISAATAFLALVSADDEVVAPEASAASGERVIEVGGGHAAMVYNPKVYRAIGDFLAP